MPLTTAQQVIDQRIEGGEEFAHRSLGTKAELHAARADYRAWNDYNKEWLRRNVGERIAREYSPPAMLAGPSGPSHLQHETQSFLDDVSRKIEKLRSIRGRLPLWADEDSTATRTLDVATDGPVFVVHGSDLSRAREVARLIDRATDREATILNEQVNRGRTILEKFEDHAIEASFAVVLLTADDEGRRVDDATLQSRGRQNVVLELGYFWRGLGRDRVVVLIDPGVEIPSDIAGLVYVEMDDGGGWRARLAMELRAAGIHVDVTRLA